MALDPDDSQGRPSDHNREWPEGRQHPDRVPAALLRAGHRTIRQGVPCCTKGCRWKFRDTSVAQVGAFERFCPRCKTAQLLVFQRGRHVGSIRYRGRDAASFRQALEELGELIPDEINLLVTIALEMAVE